MNLGRWLMMAMESDDEEDEEDDEMLGDGECVTRH